MFTNNYKKMAMFYELGASSYGVSFSQQVTNTSGNVVTTYNPSTGHMYYRPLGYCLKRPSAKASYADCSTHFGDGNTVPTENDYKLSGNIITGVSIETALSAIQEEDGVRMTAVYTITNNNTQAITISEVGIFGDCFNNAGNKTSTAILLERSVLDYPVTIEAGAFGEVTYEIKQYYPTFPTA